MSSLPSSLLFLVPPPQALKLKARRWVWRHHLPVIWTLSEASQLSLPQHLLGGSLWRQCQIHACVMTLVAHGMPWVPILNKPFQGKRNPNVWNIYLPFQCFPYLMWCLWVLTGCLLWANAIRMREHELRVTYFQVKKKKKALLPLGGKMRTFYK